MITTNTLCFAYDSLNVIENASISIDEGEFIAIFGPNGGGKSTLLNLLMGFLSPTSGKIQIFNKPPKKARQWMSYVPQHFDYDAAFPITAIEVVLGGSPISWYGSVARSEKVKAHELLDTVGLKKFVHHPFSELSGGQQQRALIARALINEPKILFLDEPTSSIDPEAGQKIYELLFSLKGKMTIIMVTHLLQSAISYADRLFCVQKSVSEKSKNEVCKHFAMGLYHP